MRMPIEILESRDNKESKYQIKISLQDALNRTSIENELFKIQKDYGDLLEAIHKIINKTHQNKKLRGNPILKWEVADLIYKFAKDLEKKEFVFANIVEAISRDLEISKRQVNYLIEFRTSYSSLEYLNEKISWDKYKELLDIVDSSFRKECELKLITGEIKTRNQLRLIKKKKL